MARRFCFFFIDACGAEVARGHAGLAKVLPHFAAVRSLLGYSSACVPAILSGHYPEENLHWSFFTRPPAGQGLRVPGWLRLIPSSLADRGRVRSKLSNFVARANGITGYFQLYQMPLAQLHRYGHCEPRDIFTRGGMSRGDSFIDELGQRKVRAWVADWHRSENDNWHDMLSAAHDRETRFLFMYAASLDAWLHDHTRTHPDLRLQLDHVAERVAAVRAAAAKHGDTVCCYLFSDHGMCTIERTLDVLTPLQTCGLRMHEDWQCVVDSTMVRAWYPDDAARSRIRAVLSGFPTLRLLSQEALAGYRCAFPDDRFGQDIWLVDPGTLLVPSHMGTTPLAGMHGYDPAHPDSDAVLMTDDPTAKADDIVGFNALMRRAIRELAA